MVGLLEEAFLQMVAESYDKEPPPGQLREMRKVFFAGAVSLYGLAPAEVPNGPITEAVLEELREFSRSLKKS